jgi:cyclic pyranopterin phosphate synthase
MPDEQIQFKPSAHLMQPNEIDAIAGMFVSMGVRKIRLTGGEPLVRKEAAEIIQSLSKYPVELTLTTNGSRADEFIPVFKEAGIRSVNVSLDTLKEERFFKITRRDQFQQVWNNIQLLIAQAFHVKINVVMMRGLNEDEILDFVALTKHQQIHIRFIEFMPFNGNHWENEKVISYQEIVETIAGQFDFIKLRDDANATAKKFKIYNHEGTFAIISTMSAPFCSTCNRMRLTADGKMKNCLFSKGEVDLLTAYRNEEDIMPIIEQCVMEKEEALGGQFAGDFHKIDAASLTNRSMIRIGG